MGRPEDYVRENAAAMVELDKRNTEYTLVDPERYRNLEYLAKVVQDYFDFRKNPGPEGYEGIGKHVNKVQDALDKIRESK